MLLTVGFAFGSALAQSAGPQLPQVVTIPISSYSSQDAGAIKRIECRLKENKRDYQCGNVTVEYREFVDSGVKDDSSANWRAYLALRLVQSMLGKDSIVSRELGENREGHFEFVATNNRKVKVALPSDTTPFRNVMASDPKWKNGAGHPNSTTAK